MNPSHAGEVAIVTGASSGIGRSVALTLARQGVRVVVGFHSNAEAAFTVAAYITAHGGSAITVQADIFSKEGCQHLVDTTLQNFKQLDICVINPGGGWHPEPPDTLDADATLEDIQREVSPVLYLLPLLLPRMYEQKSGRIIAIGMNHHLPSPAYAYNLAKASRYEALLQAHPQAWSNGVTMNVVAPGPVAEIETLAEAVEQSLHGDSWQKRTTTTSQDVAEAVAYLCSEAGRFVTGAELPLHFVG